MVVTLSMFLTGMPDLHAVESRTVLRSSEKKPLVVEKK